MLSNNYPIKNYEDFKEMFVREDGRRKNAVLLAWYKSKDMMNWIREKMKDGDTYYARELACGFKIHTMSELKDYVMWVLRKNTDYDRNGNMHDSIWVSGYGWYGSDLYRTDREGLCLDRDYRSYRYVRKDNERAFKMKMGRMFNHCIDCTTLANILPREVRLWICEEVQRDWEAYTRAQMPPQDELELHVDDDFEKIYSGRYLKGDFGSCMTNHGYHTFYTDAVKAKAAYLTDEEDMIVARCVIFTECEDLATGEIVRLAERQYSSDGKEVLKQDLITALIRGGHIDGYKKIGAGCGEANAFLSKDGESWSDRHFKISCNLDYGDTLSYQDSFKWYDMDENEAYNWYDDCQGDEFDLATTGGSLPGRNYDDYHERYTNDDVVDVYYGRWMNCSAEELDDFIYVEGEGYIHEDYVERCEECEEYFREGCGYYSEITELYYCCEDCRDEAERRYKEENWSYSEYDDEYFEDEDDVTTLKQGSCDEVSISRDSADRLVERGEAICINGKYYDAEWAECILDEA